MSYEMGVLLLPSLLPTAAQCASGTFFSCTDPPSSRMQQCERVECTCVFMCVQCHVVVWDVGVRLFVFAVLGGVVREWVVGVCVFVRSLFLPQHTPRTEGGQSRISSCMYSCFSLFICACMCVFMQVCIHACMYACMNAMCMYACMKVGICAFIICMHACMYALCICTMYVCGIWAECRRGR